MTASGTFPAAAGGTIVAGNVGITFPSGAFQGISGSVTVTITANPPSISAINAGGPSRFSPNGTILDITISDSTGRHITAFPQAVTVTMRPNAADLTMAGGSISNLTLGL